MQLQETESVTEIEDNEEKSYTMAAFSNIEVIEKTAAGLFTVRYDCQCLCVG